MFPTSSCAYLVIHITSFVNSVFNCFAYFNLQWFFNLDVSSLSDMRYEYFLPVLWLT